MDMNPMLLLQLQKRMGLFQEDHPKVMPFMQAVGNMAIEEGTVFAVKVTTADGKVLESNIKLTANDIETINMMKNANN
ncbi:hypothetical protein bpr_III012 [Butyrivibrio proteoclasticus B316]|jgi:hypothetical protein|uniref:Uncharacterized protein n=1 Tax=Butyrivibrio proteoclasticus (strain ATCC 51982 / DSM 14932 / B316) TaxID=515622 RepID=E0S2S0_BUTPB|nr:hypothetical protein [Butyrivibrio proteoclasticus]ADL35702.1 hypothetical protein bpr_III012 [Butyrivibrio proteoclasticus B316]